MKKDIHSRSASGPGLPPLHGPYFHGTHPWAVDDIRRKGFREQYYLDAELKNAAPERCPPETNREWFDAPYLYRSGGVLDDGIYISADWREAQKHGACLLQVRLAPGTRLMNLDVPADRKVIGSLTREFGHEILKKPLHKVLPQKKRLTLRELIELYRYLHQEYWGNPPDGGTGPYKRWMREYRQMYSPMFRALRGMLIRYGMHGVGSPRSPLGIVVFEGARVILEKEE